MEHAVHAHKKASQVQKSALQRLIEAESRTRRPTTLREYLAKMQMIPRLSAREPAVNGFAQPVDLSASSLRLVTGLVTSRIQRPSFQQELDSPVSVIREMLLMAYEAKPRPISFALSGYTASDFIAYIYQDVLMNDMGMSPEDRKRPFSEIVDDLKEWMRIPPEPSTTNTPRRHIRRRLMALLDRSNHQAASLFEDREMPVELVLLMQKLLERDDDQGYTRGDIKPFQEVRDDFNALGEFCIRLHYEEGSKQIESLEMVFCPASVSDVSLYSIQKPRGRPPSSRKSKTEGSDQNIGQQNKPQGKKKAQSGKVPVHHEDLDDDFGLSELEKLV